MSQAVLLGDVAEKIGMGPFGSSIKVSTFVGEGIPIISGQHLRGVKLDESSGFNYINVAHADKLKSANVYRGDVVFTHAGNIGQVAYIPHNSKYTRYVISQRQFFLRPSNKVLPEYLAYYFKCNPGKHQLLANANQVGVPSIAQPVSYLRKLKINLPVKDEQAKIVSFLRTLDRKIELNREINKTLEQTGQALFDHYFVDNLQADDWESKSLDKVADFLNGVAMQKFPPGDGLTLPVIKIREMSAGITSTTDSASANIPEQYIVHDGDILFSWSGTLIVKPWCDGPGALNQHLFKVTSDEYPKWFYYYWTKHHLQSFVETAAGKATTMGHIQRRHLTEAKVKIPPGGTMQAIDTHMQPILDQQILNELENRNLAKLRDSLLPRLISGRIRL